MCCPFYVLDKFVYDHVASLQKAADAIVMFMHPCSLHIHRDIRFIEVMETVCERLMEYNLHKEREGSNRFAKVRVLKTPGPQAQKSKILDSLLFLSLTIPCKINSALFLPQGNFECFEIYTELFFSPGRILFFVIFQHHLSILFTFFTC